MSSIELRTFTEAEYHAFFRLYRSDPILDPVPFRYNREQVARSYLYNHGGFRADYEHFGIFLDGEPVGSFQLKRIDPEKKKCEFGIILRDDSVKDRGIGTEAIRLGIRLAKEKYQVSAVLGDTMGRNKRMIRVFEKLGFKLKEIIPNAFERSDGSREDRLIYRKELTEES